MPIDIVQFASEIGLFLVSIAIAGALVLAWSQGRKYLRLRIGAAEFDRIYAEAEVVVRRLEQIGGIAGYDGGMKKQLATIALRKVRDSLDLAVSDDALDNIIEAVVQVMNTEQGKYLPEIETIALEGFAPVGGE